MMSPPQFESADELCSCRLNASTDKSCVNIHIGGKVLQPYVNLCAIVKRAVLHKVQRQTVDCRHDRYLESRLFVGFGFCGSGMAFSILFLIAFPTAHKQSGDKRQTYRYYWFRFHTATILRKITYFI